MFFLKLSYAYKFFRCLQFCDLVETISGNTDLPGYIRENPRGK